MADKKQLEHGFTVMYEKDGYYYGSYDSFPSKDDVKLIKVPVWRGHEEPKPVGPVPAGKLDIIRNGTYDITDKAEVDVNVPGATTKDLFEATANGEYDIAEYARVDINVPNPSTGNKQITTTAQTDVKDFATAQVVDANLLAENIKKDVTILGITGTLAGGSGDLDELMQETF